MEIMEIRVMRGPNYWSTYRQKLIVMRLDIGQYEQLPTNKIDGFAGRIEALIPSLYEHRCSEDSHGGFFRRVREGTWMGHVVEHIALELQILAGMKCGYGRTRSTDKDGVYNVVFAYESETAGRYAARAAVRIAQALAENLPYDIEEDVQELRYIWEDEQFGPTTASIVEEAKKRNIPFRRMNNQSFVLFGHGNRQKKIVASMTGDTSSLAVDCCGDKKVTKQILAKAYIPVAGGTTVRDNEGLMEAVNEIGFPLVIKPIDGNHGRGVVTNIRTHRQAIDAFQIASEISRTVIVERFITGCDYRILLVDYKFVAAARRTPAMITGDGTSTIGALIDAVNSDPRRGNGHTKILSRIRIDKVTENILSQKNYTLETILPEGEILYLKNSANLSSGGTSTDVTDLVHPKNIQIAERAARVLGIDICGIDIISPDISIPLDENGGAVIEVNAGPGFRMHLAPSEGLPRNVAAPVMDMLYPKGSTARIPIVAITGTNGKTTTTRLIAHMASVAGHTTGFTTTDGIYIANELIYAGDCTGSVSAESVLTDPAVSFAVLECARGGIIRAGLGFDQCDIGIITNITADHLGLKGIHTLDDMLRVKAVVVNSVHRDGYAILNADDDNVYKLARELDCNVALFSTSADNPRILEHCSEGGYAAVIENNYLVVYHGAQKTPVQNIRYIPLSMSGTATSMIKNLLPATLAGLLSGFSLAQVRSALASFIPSPVFTPGRMNMFNFKNFDLMIDYVHNAGGFEEMKNFLEKREASMKIGIVAGIGDRRDEDIRDVGRYAAQLFDHVIIRCDKDLRGRPAEEINRLVQEGVYEIDRSKPVNIIPDETQAMLHALSIAEPGAFVMMSAETVHEMTKLAAKLREQEKAGENIFELELAKVS